MTTLTFTGNNYGEIMAQVMQYMQQVGAQVLPPQAATAHTAPLQPPTPQPAPPAPVVPTAAPAAPVAPVALQTAPPAQAVPTSAPDYTHEQLGRAIASWVDKIA